MSEITIISQADAERLEHRITAIERTIRDRALAAITELQRLSVQRDDTIVVRIGDDDGDVAAYVRDAVRRVTGHTRVLVIGPGTEISVAERAS